MGLQAISWQAYWLDDAWTKPGKTHAFVRGVCGTGYVALCGYEPAYNCNPMHREEPRCKRCEAKAKQTDMPECI